MIKIVLTQDKKPLKLKFYDKQMRYEQLRESDRQVSLSIS